MDRPTEYDFEGLVLEYEDTISTQISPIYEKGIRWSQY